MTFTPKDSSAMDNAAKLIESDRLDEEISLMGYNADALARQCADALFSTRTDKARTLAEQRNTMTDDIDAMRRESNRLYCDVHGRTI